MVELQGVACKLNIHEITHKRCLQQFSFLLQPSSTKETEFVENNNEKFSFAATQRRPIIYSHLPTPIIIRAIYDRYWTYATYVIYGGGMLHPSFWAVYWLRAGRFIWFTTKKCASSTWWGVYSYKLPTIHVCIPSPPTLALCSFNLSKFGKLLISISPNGIVDDLHLQVARLRTRGIPVIPLLEMLRYLGRRLQLTQGLLSGGASYIMCWNSRAPELGLMFFCFFGALQKNCKLTWHEPPTDGTPRSSTAIKSLKHVRFTTLMRIYNSTDSEYPYSWQSLHWIRCRHWF